MSHSPKPDPPNNHSFKLKFSPDKVDTMVVQAIALLDDLDKEVNIYSMRVKVRSQSRDLEITLLTCIVGMVRLALPRDG
jgi:nucleolar protein 58